MNRKALVLSSLLLVISLLSVAIMPAVPVSACCYEGKPSIDVTKTACATSSGAEGVISITNAGEVPVDVETITDTVYWKGKGSGGWQLITSTSVPLPASIAPGVTVYIPYTIDFDTPGGARELRNVVEVTIWYRDKTFREIVSFLP